VLEALLRKYQDEGVTDLDDPRILKVAPFDTMVLRLNFSRNSVDETVLCKPSMTSNPLSTERQPDSL
jgi:hypothetical protein